jgi:hypothetical protein
VQTVDQDPVIDATDEEGGPLLRYPHAHEYQKSFDRTCKKHDKFLMSQQVNPLIPLKTRK